jgi:hypothetical protein
MPRQHLERRLGRDRPGEKRRQLAATLLEVEQPRRRRRQEAIEIEAGVSPGDKKAFLLKAFSLSLYSARAACGAAPLVLRYDRPRESARRIRRRRRAA